MAEEPAQFLGYASVPPKRRPRPIHITKRQWAVAAFCFLITVIVALHWPRLQEGEVLVYRSERTANALILEYRMPTPFEAQIRHGTFGDSMPIVTVATYHSHYDILRGEHYIRMTFTRGSTLAVECDHVTTTVQPRISPDAHQAKWAAPGKGTWLGNGVGMNVVTIDSNGMEEYLILYAGTDLPKR